MNLRQLRLVGLVAVLMVPAGCGSEPDSGTGAGAPVVVASSAAPATPSVVPTTTSTFEPDMIKVPDGVGMDYQAAQDAWRAAGLVVAPAKDATGANRVPLVDRNWVVLKQDVTAGSQVPEGTLITAIVKKFSDD